MAAKLALITTGVLAVAGLLVTPTVASAQPGLHSTQSSSDQVNPTPLLRTYPPQRGFDPLTASDPQLVAHGFPRRPTSPIALKAWKNAMARATNYVAPNPVYSSLRHGTSKRNVVAPIGSAVQVMGSIGLSDVNNIKSITIST